MKIYFILMALLSIGFFIARYAFIAEFRKYFGLPTYLSLAVILAAGFVLHDSLLWSLFAAAVFLLTVTSRVDALCRLAILAALLPHLGYTLYAGSLYLVQLSSTITLALAALVACFLRQGGRPPRRITAEDALVFVLFLCFGVAAARTGSFTAMQRSVVMTALELGLPYYVYRRFLGDRNELGDVVAALAGCAIILAIVAIAEARLHWAIYDSLYANLSASGIMSSNLKIRAGLLRAPGSYLDATAFALFQTIGVFAVIASRRVFRSSLLYAGSIALTILGMLAAQSRGANLALIFGLFAMLVMRRRYALASTVAGAGALGVALMIALAASSPRIAQIIGADQHNGGDQDYRQTLLRRGLQVGMEHPVLGDSKINVLDRLVDITQGEHIIDLVNTYLNIFLFSGFTGLILVIILITIIFQSLFLVQYQKGQDDVSAYRHIFIAGALGGELFALIFTSFYERNPFWLMILLAGSRLLRVQAPVRNSPQQEFERGTGPVARLILADPRSMADRGLVVDYVSHG